LVKVNHHRSYEHTANRSHHLDH